MKGFEKGDLIRLTAGWAVITDQNCFQKSCDPCDHNLTKDCPTKRLQEDIEGIIIDLCEVPKSKTMDAGWEFLILSEGQVMGYYIDDDLKFPLEDGMRKL